MYIVKVMYKNTACKISCLKEHQNREIGDIVEIWKGEIATNSDLHKSSVIGSQEAIHLSEPVSSASKWINNQGKVF